MQFDSETRLQELAETYPWLIDKVASLDPRLKIAKSAVGRALIRRSTIGDASRMSGYPVEKLVQELIRLIEEHQEQPG